MPDALEEISRAIRQATGRPFSARHRHDLPGGCINAAALLEDGNQRYFVKLNNAAGLEMFSAEAEGLALLRRAAALRVPAPICHGAAAGRAFLVLEYLDLRAGDAASQERLGHALAGLHRVTDPNFGWTRHNTIGSSPQKNTPSPDWPAFWRDHRLGFQLALARSHGYPLPTCERLLLDFPVLFQGYRPRPSLLHGDLWSGNQAATPDGEPVVFDPAVYFGDREADLAMTELFGGFSGRFYAAYRESWPLDAGYPTRKGLYNLYHVLNHLNLFGGGYLAQAEHLIDQLLAEFR